MATQPAVGLRPINKSQAIRDLRATASERTLMRMCEEEKFYDQRMGIMSRRNEKRNEIQAENVELNLQLTMARRERERTGQDYATERTEKDPKTGQETVIRTTSPVIAKLEAHIAANTRAMKALLAEPLPESAHTQIEEFLHGRPPDFEFVDSELPTVTLNAGEDEEAAYHRQCAALADLKREAKRIWDIPRTADEIMARVKAEIQASAKMFSLGGLIRGHGLDMDGEPTIESPKAGIGWPSTRLNISVQGAAGAYASGFDAKSFLCAVMGNTILQSAADHLKKNLPAETMTAAAKAPIIEKLLADIWQQKRVCEEYFIAARARGFKVKRNQNQDLETEIILGIEKAKPRRPVAKAMPAPVADPDPLEVAPVEDADEFES